MPKSIKSNHSQPMKIIRDTQSFINLFTETSDHCLSLESRSNTLWTTINYSFYLILQCFLLRLTDLQDIYILIISLSFGLFNSEAHLTIIFWMFVTDYQAACIKVKFSIYTELMYTLLTQHMPSVVPALAAACTEPYTTIKALKHYILYTLHIHWESIHHPDYTISTIRLWDTGQLGSNMKPICCSSKTQHKTI